MHTHEHIKITAMICGCMYVSIYPARGGKKSFIQAIVATNEDGDLLSTAVMKSLSRCLSIYFSTY